VDRERPSVDPDGWQYAVNWTGSWSAQRGVATVVRRRRWVRVRVLNGKRGGRPITWTLHPCH
jgi:hypothetical protein